MSKIKVSRFDASEHLRDEATIAAYINAALDEGDPDLLMAAIADVAKARGVAQVAQAAGLGRESLYKTLSAGSKPRLDTVFKLLGALNLRLIAMPLGGKNA
ncbi:addiction module antidote protein [Pararobbsia silviterrae]|uniref:Putative addiction module antidote protein n=1 Tax=Pararobbsia silviterrae TaxID=1792498 RepID=A0A494XUC2_9BURK|nr:addiction module antidote protein [Pararobbsia silviterrae]RKP53442.1 putative addiction module antidote protein [Pararobbsia silviterrae]